MTRGHLYSVAGILLTLLVAHPLESRAKAASSDTYRLLTLLGDVFERIRADLVEKPDDAKLIEAAINGMLAGVDPHSSYIDAKSFRDMQAQTRGDFGGSGVEMIMEHGLVRVVAPIENSPADRAGILADDIITHVDNEPLQNLTLNQVVEKMRGPVNSKTIFKILRKGTVKPFEVTITREIVRVHSVRFDVDGEDVGYIRLTQFNEQTTDSLKKAIADIAAKLPETKLKGYVLDLRNNPGGLFDQAISVSDAFLEKGEIVSTRGRDEMQRYNARAGDLAKGKPVIVLINGGSAAASEIVAGALQEHKRATILGTRSFGRGTVQTIIPLGSGSGALRLTTSRFHTPLGRQIQENGILPDIEVRQDAPDDLEKGTQARIPANRKDDKALVMALALIRGTQSHKAFPPTATPAASTSQPSPTLASNCARAEIHWKSAEQIKTLAVYEDHLARFATCDFATLARARINALKR
ncbi:MAG: S41 family peptidase [Pseudolabrys sp.]